MLEIDSAQIESESVNKRSLSSTTTNARFPQFTGTFICSQFVKTFAKRRSVTNV